MALRYTLRQLEYFVAAGKAGSIALAAEAITVSPPAISAAIGQLEAEFGVRLFMREHARGMSLTPTGRVLFERAKCLLTDAAELRDVAGEIEGPVRGPIRIGCLNTLAPLVLAGIRRSFTDAHPNVDATQFISHQAALFTALQRAEIDVALTYRMQIPTDLEFLPLADLLPHAMVAPDHPLADRETTTLADLAGFDMILLDQPVSREYFLQLFRDAGVKPRIGERSTDFFVVRSLVANGFGYSIANLRPLSETAPDGRPITSLRLEDGLAPLALGIVTTFGRRRTRPVQAFHDHCRAILDRGVIPGMRPSI